MSGIIILKRDDEIISHRRYKGPATITTIKDMWQKIYGPKYATCHTEEIPDIDPRQKSTYKKGNATSRYTIKKTHRGTQRRPNN